MEEEDEECFTLVVIGRDEERLSAEAGFFNSVLEKLRKHPRCGAISTFAGITREDKEHGKKVTGLEFQAHVPLAETTIRDIITACRKEMPEKIISVYVHHQLGHVAVNQVNIFIAVSASHRKDAFRAVELLMDRIKAYAPIWKKEIYDNDTHVWKENNEFHNSSLNDS